MTGTLSATLGAYRPQVVENRMLLTRFMRTPVVRFDRPTQRTAPSHRPCTFGVNEGRDEKWRQAYIHETWLHLCRIKGNGAIARDQRQIAESIFEFFLC